MKTFNDDEEGIHENTSHILDFISETDSTFLNDGERIQELKTCLEKSYELLHNTEKMEDVYDIVRTLIKDTLSRYAEDKKFLTA